MRQFNTLTGFLLSKSSNPSINDIVGFSGYDSAGDGGDAQWKHNGVTGQTPSQSPAQLGDALLNDGNGNQYRLVGNVIKPAQVNDSMLALLSSGLVIDMTGAGSVALTSQLTISQDINIFCRDDSVITGYDGLGILFSGSNIKLDGVNISGFYDGTELNKENYATSFLRIATGTTVDSITVKSGSALNCRSVIRGTGDSSDTAVDTTINVKKTKIIGHTINGCPLAFYFRCAYTDAIVTGNTCLNAIGASKGLTPYSFYVDGVGFDAAIYSQIGSAIFSNNFANTIVNRTTTGDSSPGNSYECHLFKASGEKVTIENNIVNDCTGVNDDCEAFYTKARYSIVNNNVLIDAGTNEGVINVKGTSATSDGSNTSPFGDTNKVNDNIIVFTRDTYDNGGTIVNLEMVGIHVAVPERSIVSGNIIKGANVNDIVMDGAIGPATANSESIVSGNISSSNAGASSIKYRGAFKRTKAFGNICADVLTDGKSFAMFDLVSVSNRGNFNENNEFYDNQLKLGDKTSNETGFTHSFISIDVENYTFNNFVVNSNLIDIVSTNASARPVYVFSQTVSPAGSISKLTVKYNNFANGSYSIGPVFLSKIPLSFDFYLEYNWQSTQNSAMDAIQISTADGTATDAEIKVFSTRVDVTGQAQRDISNLIGYTAASVLNTINNSAESPVGNATGIGVTLATTAENLRVRISGEDAQTWNHKINLVCSNR